MTFPSIIDAVRAEGPLVHCMTNTVVPEVTANILLAIGAAPAMIDLPEEAEIFATLASALLINVGNGSAEQHEGMRRAAAAAQASGTPWVLDPVAVGALPVRTQLARDLLAHEPTVIRANASEILGLAGASTGGRGVDSTDEVDAAIDVARQLNADTGTIVAISGETDVIVSKDRLTKVTGGHEMMQLVIGTGCALGATVAACLAAGPFDERFLSGSDSDPSTRSLSGSDSGPSTRPLSGSDSDQSKGKDRPFDKLKDRESRNDPDNRPLSGSDSDQSKGKDRDDAHDAVVGAHAWFAAAGSIAGQEATHPGSFRTAFIDALHALDWARVSELVHLDEG